MWKMVLQLDPQARDGLASDGTPNPSGPVVMRVGARACIVISSLLIFVEAHAGTLSTSFVDVAVNDVPLGQEKRVENKEGKSLVLWNSGEAPLVIHIDALKPTAEELRPPAEPIEDPGWIRIILPR